MPWDVSVYLYVFLDREHLDGCHVQLCSHSACSCCWASLMCCVCESPPRSHLHLLVADLKALLCIWTFKVSDLWTGWCFLRRGGALWILWHCSGYLRFHLMLASYIFLASLFYLFLFLFFIFWCCSIFSCFTVLFLLNHIKDGNLSLQW